MRFRAVVLLYLCGCLQMMAQPGSQDEAAIRAGMNAQVQAWNRGDIPGFMREYEKSADTTFVGTTVQKGYEPILKRYQDRYSTPQQMGTLTFSDLDIRLLPDVCGKAQIALVTGRFHLQRQQRGEANKDDGLFSLVWRKGQDGWRIVLDHTS
jgi:uncharacterized protein (TIGR02246 family)